MEEDQIFKHFIDQLFPNCYGVEDTMLKPICYGSFVAKGILTENLFSAIVKSLYALNNIVCGYWRSYLFENVKYAISSPAQYIFYVIRPCCAEKLLKCDAYEKFIYVSALIIAIGGYTYRSTGRNFLNLTPIILTEIFENALKEEFYKRGGWECLEKYILSQDYVEYFDKASDFCLNNANMEHPREFDEMTTKIFARRLPLYSWDIINETSRDNQLVKEIVGKVISSSITSCSTKLFVSQSKEQSTLILKETPLSNSSSKLSSIDQVDSNPIGSTQNNEINVNLSDADISAIFKKIKVWFATNGPEAEKLFACTFHEFLLGLSTTAIQSLQRNIKHLISTFDSLEVQKND